MVRRRSKEKFGLEPTVSKPMPEPVIQSGMSGAAEKPQQNQIRTSVTAPTLGIGIEDKVMKFNSVSGLWIGNRDEGSAPFKVDLDGAMSATGAAITGTINATSGTITGSLVIGSGGNIRSGQTDYNTGTGFWMGDDSGTVKLSLGNSSGNTLTWGGGGLNINGNLSINTLSGSNALFIYDHNINSTGGVLLSSYATGSAAAVFDAMADGLTTTNLMRLRSASVDTSSRELLEIINFSSYSVNTTPLLITQNALVSTNFQRVIDAGGSVLWRSDGTTPNGNLSGTQGDICLNGTSGQTFYCTGTTNWTGM